MEKIITLGKKEEFAVLDSKGRSFVQADSANKCLVLGDGHVVVDLKDNVIQLSGDFILVKDEEILLKVDAKKSLAEINTEVNISKQVKCADVVTKTQLVEEVLTVATGENVFVADGKKKQVDINGKLVVNGKSQLCGKVSNIKLNESKNIEFDGIPPKTGTLMFEIVATGKDKFAGMFVASKFQEEDRRMTAIDMATEKMVDISFVWKKNGDVSIVIGDLGSSDKWKGEFDANIRVV